MRIKGIIWVGSATDDLEATSKFFENRLGLELTTNVRGFTRLEMEDGDRIEIFGPESAEHDQLDTGPVAGFKVADVEAARQELIDAGVSSCTEIETARDGHRWFYFRAPDGNFYELCEHHDPRPVKAPDGDR